MVGGEQPIRSVVGADRQQLLIRELGHGQKVPCSGEDRMTESGYRVEHDSMGEVRVPAGAQWGAQTQRAIENFPISGRPIAPALVHALALIKAEAAQVNQLDRTLKEA